MNDDFLHRPRRAPSPEFLAALKARLDRQPLERMPRLARSRRSGFFRGMLVGFLVAGAAFAVTSVSLTGVPTSADQFFSAPIEYVARILFHAHTEQDADRNQIKAVPLGPAFYPTHVNPQAAAAKGDFKNATDTDSATYIGAPPAPTGTVAASTPTVLIGASRELLPFAQASAPAYASKIPIKVIEQPDQTAFGSLCRNSSSTDEHRPDIIAVAHRITAEQLRNCTYGGYTHETELLVGYQAVVLARSKLYGPLSLTARDLLLALARRVPDPEHPDTLIDNPYTAWNQIDPALPYDKIHFIGPAPDSPEGRVIAAMLLEPGCGGFPSLAALRDRDPAAFDAACHRLRNDGTYEESPVNGWYAGFAQINALNTVPTAFGIFTLQGLAASQDKLATNPIDGVTPDHTAIAAHAYPASRPLYLYVYSANMQLYAVSQTVQTMTLWAFPNTATGATTWGFVPPDAAELAVRRETLRKFW